MEQIDLKLTCSRTRTMVKTYGATLVSVEVPSSININKEQASFSALAQKFHPQLLAALFIFIITIGIFASIVLNIIAAA